MDRYGWRSVMIAMSIVSIAWWGFWFCAVANSPSEDRTISASEFELITGKPPPYPAQKLGMAANDVLKPKITGGSINSSSNPRLSDINPRLSLSASAPVVHNVFYSDPSPSAGAEAMLAVNESGANAGSENDYKYVDGPRFRVEEAAPYRLFCVGHFWGLLLIYLAYGCALYCLLTELPSYLSKVSMIFYLRSCRSQKHLARLVNSLDVSQVLGFDLEHSAFLSVLPYLCMTIR